MVLGPGALTEVGELHSLTDWQVSEASEDAELEDFCSAEVSRWVVTDGEGARGHTGQRGREEKKEFWSQRQYTVGSLIQHLPLYSHPGVTVTKTTRGGSIPGPVQQTRTCPRPKPRATYLKASTKDSRLTAYVSWQGKV